MKSFHFLAILAIFAAAVAIRGPLTSNAPGVELIKSLGRLESEPANPFSSGVLTVMKDLVSGSLKSAVHVEAADVDSALLALQQRALIVVIQGNWLTKDHSGLPFVSVNPNSRATKIIPFLPYMNTMSTLLETFSPQKFIPFTVDTFSKSSNALAADTYVIFDLHNGHVFIREDAVGTIDNIPDETLHESYRKFSRHVQTKAAERGQVPFTSPTEMFEAFGLPLSEVLVNPWVLCAACMFALVFIAPLAANYILINLALYLCTALNLTDNTCTALWSSAVALVFISMPLMAYGIYTVCGLYQCQHPNPTKAF